MKFAIIAGLFLSTSLWAHEGHNHGTAQEPVSTPAAQNSLNNSSEAFSSMASHLSFKTAHIHAYWSHIPDTDHPANLRLELRDFETHEILKETPEIFVGYRLVGAKNYELSPVLEAKTDGEGFIAGTFDTGVLNLNQTGTWEFMVLMKRADKDPEIQTFQWPLNATK